MPKNKMDYRQAHLDKGNDQYFKGKIIAIIIGLILWALFKIF
jgi:hypothetical protein